MRCMPRPVLPLAIGALALTIRVAGAQSAAQPAATHHTPDDSAWVQAVGRPALMALSVADLGRAEAWYARVLGFAVASRHDFSPAGISVVFLDRGGFRLELIQHRLGRPRRPLLPDSTNDATLHRFGKVTFHARDLSPLIAHLQAERVPFVNGPRPDQEGHRSFMIHDPEGNLWQFVERP